MKHARLPILLLFPLILLAACGSSAADPADPAETSSPPDVPATTLDDPQAEFEKVVAELNDTAASSGFACLGDGYLVTVAASGDSLVASRPRDPATERVDVLTVGWVSYAKVTPGTAELPEPRRSIVERVGSNWGSWGEPDTTLLEMTPSSPSMCLGWEGVYAATVAAAEQRSSGEVVFRLTLSFPSSPDLTAEDSREEQGAPTRELTGVYTPSDQGSPSRLLVADNGQPFVGVAAGPGVVELPELVRDEVVELSRDEYMLLVGAAAE